MFPMPISRFSGENGQMDLTPLPPKNHFAFVSRKLCMGNSINLLLYEKDEMCATENSDVTKSSRYVVIIFFPFRAISRIWKILMILVSKEFIQNKLTLEKTLITGIRLTNISTYYVWQIKHWVTNSSKANIKFAFMYVSMAKVRIPIAIYTIKYRSNEAYTPLSNIS